MGLLVLTAFDLYLRPGRALSLKAKNILPPVCVAGSQFRQMTVVIRDFESGKPGKVGVFNNALRLDNPKTLWIGPHLLNLARQQNSAEDAVFSFTMEEFRKQFMQAGKDLGGGASQDLSSTFRGRNAVKMRGRWKTDQSVRRYAKVGGVQQLLTKLIQSALQYCQWAEHNVENVFKGTVAPKGF